MKVYINVKKHQEITTLYSWIEKQNTKSVDGIIQPTVDGLKHAIRLKTKEQRVLELSPAEIKNAYANNNEDLLNKCCRVCEMYFLKSDHVWCRAQVKEALETPPDFLVLDSLGDLEIQGEGFSPLLKDIFDNRFKYPNMNIILSMRQKKVSRICDFLNLKDGDFLYFSDEL